MHLVEQHVIDQCDPRYRVIDEAAFKSKNLYNAALYEIRQAYIHEGIYLTYSEMDRCMQSHEAYKALPAPDAFAKGIAAYVVQPVRLAIPV